MCSMYVVLAFCTCSFAREMLNIDLLNLSERAFGKPSKETGQRLARWRPEDGGNPEELGDYEQGDILFVNTNHISRSGTRHVSFRWPNGIVPYEIFGNFEKRELSIIRESMDDYHKNTCIRFRPRQKTDLDYVMITSSNAGCYSAIGRVGGPQITNLQPIGCFPSKGTTLHELMHVLGFFHEQSREDRDDYVKILWNNIIKSRVDNFVKQRGTDDYGISYNYGSIMHYSSQAFSMNSLPTIVPLREGGSMMGQRFGLTNGDVRQINSMYKCPKSLFHFMNIVF